MTSRLLLHDRVEEFVARRIGAPSEVSWGYGIPMEPLKRFFMPQRDTILRFSQNGKTSVAPVYDEQDRVFLAARCCDVTGVTVQDAMYGGKYEDPYYFLRRR